MNAKKNVEPQMIAKLRSIEGTIVDAKRARRKAIEAGLPTRDLNSEIEKAKAAAGRIRKHLKEGAYV